MTRNDEMNSWSSEQWEQCSAADRLTDWWKDGYAASCARESSDTKVFMWVMFLAPWQCMFTGTFRWSASVWSAEKSFLQFMGKKAPGVSFYYVVEPHPGGHGFHVHAIFAARDEIHRKGLWEKWFEKYGRALVEPIKDITDVTQYIADYLLTTGSHGDFHGGPVLVDPGLYRCAQQGIPGRFEQRSLNVEGGSGIRPRRDVMRNKHARAPALPHGVVVLASPGG